MERIREILTDLKIEGYTQSSFAEELGKDQGTVSKWLNGKMDVPESIAIIIEAKFGYRKEWILDGKLPKKIDRKQELAEVARISKQGRDLDLVPELRDLLPDIKKLKEEDYNVLITTIKRFLGKK
ncbi:MULTISPECIES: helix-turn-helix domain-containing protein [Leptospira]|uniref:helix-turn-helix domain-containing protein n=1 Tax=Leptospira TaxID=171 RepID=UPI001090F0C7|nr:MULTISPECIES: helix-turn-helix transcriptional regulator [Leptospira]TGL97957.1 XRE family transcriptional regulator [Leptospira jelokensis]TGM88270.1 XRE family transcriptional regulator [Leptospira bouyouniensis]